MDVSVCIVNWNTKELLYKCIKSIKEKTIGLTYEIIVVDNGSSDGSAGMVRRVFPDCKLLESDNVGFAKANNKAAKQAIGKYILFLNPDTELITNAIYEMYCFLKQNKDYGAVGCKLLNLDGSIQYTCARKFPTPLREFSYLTFLYRLFPKSKILATSEIDYWDHRGNSDVDCLSGACIMVPKKLIDRIGAFDEAYFMYGEDIEFCHRIRQKEWRIHYLATSEIFHFSGSSSKQRKEKAFSAILQRSSNYQFMKDNYGNSSAKQFRFAVLLGCLFRVVTIIFFILLLRYRPNSGKNMRTDSITKYVQLIRWALRVAVPPFDKN